MRFNPISKISVAVVEPEFGLNLGYVARTMSNFGFNNLIIVSPSGLDEKRLVDARVFASHARDLLDHTERVSSVAKLRRRFHLLVGTTAIRATRKSNLTRKTLDIEDCIPRISGRILAQPDSVCILFGRDTTGLTNDELRSCDYNITIRASDTYNTLNVSHAAAIVLFALSRGVVGKPKRTRGIVSTRKERERAMLLFEELAEVSGFQKFKSAMLKETIRKFFDRADPSLRETYLLMGLASKAVSKIQRLSNGLP